MDIVTYETAQALKKVGFNCPNPKPGMVFYDLLVAQENPNHILYQHEDELIDQHGNYHSVEKLQKGTFAPTAVDIMRQLPNYCTLERVAGQRNFWRVINDVPRIYKTSDNPAEACAKVFLQLKGLSK